MGMCYIETSNLDGETNLKIRQVSIFKKQSSFKKWVCAASNFIILISTLFIGNFFRSWMLKDCIISPKANGKENGCHVFSSPLQTWNWDVSHHSCAVTARKCTKTHVASAELMFCQSEPVAFLPFSLSSPLCCVSSCLITCNIYMQCMYPDAGILNDTPWLRN